MKDRLTDKDVTPEEISGPDGDDENFLSRWSRRKHKAQQVGEKSEGSPQVVDEPVESVNHLTDADMPPLESLTEDSDYSGFLSPKVSEALRKQALRKLFHSTGINVRDGLDDYDEDYTEFAKLGDIVTADIRHRLEQEMRFQDKGAPTEPVEATTTVVEQETIGQTAQTLEHDDEASPEEETS